MADAPFWSSDFWDIAFWDQYFWIGMLVRRVSRTIPRPSGGKAFYDEQAKYMFQAIFEEEELAMFIIAVVKSGILE
jgi:hypothetical protein